VKKSKVLGKTLKNANGMRNPLGLPATVGNGRYTLLNANGDIDTSSSGFQYIIDTLTHIRSQIVEQKFYEIAPADFVPVDVGEGSWMEDIVQNLTFHTGGSFYEGDVDIQTETSRLAQVGAGLDKLSMPVKTWAKQCGWTIMEISKAAAANNWDVVSGKMKSLKKNWDLGIQETCFLGHPVTTALKGLLNDDEVNINTTLITKPLSEMTETEFTAFVAGILPAYFANSNDTALPDTFVMPNSDYLGMSAPYSPSFPNISKLEYLLNAMRKTTQNEGFQVLGLSYSDSARNASRGISKNRYALYKYDPETLKMSIPVDLTLLEADTTNKINWIQAGYGQYSGTLINRKREVLYLDETAT